MTKYALITGSSAGIGKGIALRLLADGFHVITNGRSLERLHAAFKDVDADTRARLHYVVADVSVADEIARLIASVSAITGGQLDVLVNNAGNLAAGGLVFGSSTWKDAEFEQTLRTFVNGPVYLLNKAVPLLEAAVKVNGTANVINISSVMGSRPAAGFVPYSMAKAAIDALSKGAAAELAPKGIRVNAVAPGVTQSEIMASSGMSAEAVVGFQTHQASLIPLKRIGEPEDIANAVAYLVDSNPRSKLTSWVTGVVLTVDGGHSIRSPLE